MAEGNQAADHRLPDRCSPSLIRRHLKLDPWKLNITIQQKSSRARKGPLPTPFFALAVLFEAGEDRHPSVVPVERLAVRRQSRRTFPPSLLPATEPRTGPGRLNGATSRARNA